MGRMIDRLFYIQDEKGGFDHLDAMLTSECETSLQSFKQRMPSLEYERMRDAVFSIAYHAKKSAFEIGVKTAIRIILECEEKE